MNTCDAMNWSEVANRLRFLRESQHLSYESLRRQILNQYGVNISKDSLRNYEVSEDEYNTHAGKVSGMSIEKLCCLADFYGVSTDYLLHRTDMKSPDPSQQEACRYTGLTEDAAMRLKINNDFFCKNHPHDGSRPIQVLSTLLTDSEFWQALNTAAALTSSGQRDLLQQFENQRVKYNYDDPVSEVFLIEDSEIDKRCMGIAHHITNVVMKQVKPKIEKEVSTDAE